MVFIAGEFAELADEFIEVEALAFAKVLIMRTAAAVTYGSAQTYTSETGTGVATSLDYSAFNNELIEAGDLRIATNASQWTTDPQLDNVDITFDGDNYQIILVEKDADNAAYFLTVRRK